VKTETESLDLLEILTRHRETLAVAPAVRAERITSMLDPGSNQVLVRVHGQVDRWRGGEITGRQTVNGDEGTVVVEGRLTSAPSAARQRGWLRTWLEGPLTQRELVLWEEVGASLVRDEMELERLFDPLRELHLALAGMGADRLHRLPDSRLGDRPQVHWAMDLSQSPLDGRLGGMLRYQYQIDVEEPWRVDCRGRGLVSPAGGQRSIALDLHQWTALPDGAGPDGEPASWERLRRSGGPLLA
jgi:hypothetical protein